MKMIKRRSSSLTRRDLFCFVRNVDKDEEPFKHGSTSTLTLQKILQLFENKKFDECTQIIRRLSSAVVENIAKELPMTDMINQIPQTLGMVEAMYSRISFTDPKHPLLRELYPESLVSKIIIWLAGISTESPKSCNLGRNVDLYRPTLVKLFSVIIVSSPQLKMKLTDRLSSLNNCLDSLGRHGLVCTTTTQSTKMTSIHDALKTECVKSIQNIKLAVRRLDDIGPSNMRIRVSSASSHQEPEPSSSFSHQRLMQATVKDVEDRLIKNKTLLDSVESLVGNNSLSELLTLLKHRIDKDKEVLFNLTELPKEMQLSTMNSTCAVTPFFHQLTQGYSKVVGILNEISTNTKDFPDNLSQENLSRKSRRQIEKSPTIINHVAEVDKRSKQKEQNFWDDSCFCNIPDHMLLLKSRESPPVACSVPIWHSSPNVTEDNSNGSCDHQVSTNPDRHEVEELQEKMEIMKKELANCHVQITKLQEREKALMDRLSQQAQMHLEKSTTKFEDVNLGNNRPTQLIRRYGNLYAEGRLDVLDALDELSELSEFDELKSKLLFSVVILGFRSAQKSLHDLKMQYRQLLGMTTGDGNTIQGDPLANEVESTVTLYLRKNTNRRNISHLIKEVHEQVLSTLYDYPGLRDCRGLKNYITDIVQLAWILSVQNPPYVLEFESRTFRSDLHTHFHTSDPDSTTIKSYIWPGLREGERGPCVYKGVIVT